MGKVKFENGVLTVTTNNGEVNSNGEQIVNIISEEEFTIEAESIARLLNAIGDLTVCGKGWRNSSFYDYYIIPNSKTAKIIDEYRENIDKLRTYNRDLQNELDDIKHKIRDYNRKQHLFWRPIKIED